MEKTRSCTICKHLGLKSIAQAPLSIEKLYDYYDKTADIKIYLCTKHSVELFKLGQKRFLLNYKDILFDLVNSDEKEFIDILAKTIKNNPNAAF